MMNKMSHHRVITTHRHRESTNAKPNENVLDQPKGKAETSNIDVELHLQYRKFVD